jgi:hypothetical protein
VPPDDSYGIWQINMLGSMGPSRRKALNIDNNDALFDPSVNARAMAMISGGGHNWRPWSTYTNNAYQGHMAAVNSALQSGVGDPVEHAPGGASPAMPSLVMAGRGGSQVKVVAPIYLTVKEASDDEARRFAAKIKQHLEGVVKDVEEARAGR